MLRAATDSVLARACALVEAAFDWSFLQSQPPRLECFIAVAGLTLPAITEFLWVVSALHIGGRRDRQGLSDDLDDVKFV